MKYFSDNTLTKKQLRVLICKFAANYGVKKVSFNTKAKYIAGSYNYLKKSIFVDLKQSRKEILRSFFHELSHHISASRQKWLLYHMNAATPYLSPTKKFYIENKIDKQARKLWREHVNKKAWGNYLYGYPRSEKKITIKWFDTYL